MPVRKAAIVGMLAEHVTIFHFERFANSVGHLRLNLNWDENKDEESGFLGFITYIGTTGEFDDLMNINALVQHYGGYFNKNEGEARESKRVEAYPYEIKVRGLKPEDIKLLGTNLIFDM
jgi:hypothetical protein